MSNNLTEGELRAWRGLLVAHSRVIQRLDAELTAETTLTLSAYEILLVLAGSPGRALRMSDLAAKLLLSRSGVTRAVDQLVTRGLIERRRCPSDARGYFAGLTEAGYTELRAAAPIHVRGVRRHFLSRLDRVQLEVLGEAFEAVAGGAPAGMVGR